METATKADRIQDAAVIITARKLRDWTQSALAVHAKVGLVTVGRIENADPAVSFDTLAKVANALQQIVDYPSGRILASADLPNGAVAREVLLLAKTVRKKEVPAGFEVVSMGTIPIPTWDIDVSANSWVEVPICALDYDDPGQRLVVDTGRFRLRIKGHCMEDVYASGVTLEFEILRIDRQALELLGDYVVCKSDGTGTFKRLVAMDEDSLTLAAINQAEFPGVIVVARQEVSRIAVFKHILADRPKPGPLRIRKRKGP